MSENKIIMGIETSCDDTSIAIVENGKKVLSNIISSQTKIHQKYGGVVPEIASRKHMDYIYVVCKEALEEAKIDLMDIDGIAVANGPGLKGSLLVGLSFAKAIAFALNKPLVGINHIEGHIFANYLMNDDIKTPFIALVVSGGHTSLIISNEFYIFKTIGKTRDDAAGEVFDKIAKYLNLGYPGGPEIEKLAKNGDKNYISFPRPLLKNKTFDFSFSGLKTSVIYYTKKLKNKGKDLKKDNICASFQQAVVETLICKTISAAKKCNIKRILIGGGVAANESLRRQLKKEAEKEKMTVYYPSKNLCTDNAAMIAVAGYHKIKKGLIDSYELDVYTG